MPYATPRVLCRSHKMENRHGCPVSQGTRYQTTVSGWRRGLVLTMKSKGLIARHLALEHPVVHGATSQTYMAVSLLWNLAMLLT